MVFVVSIVRVWLVVFRVCGLLGWACLMGWFGGWFDLMVRLFSFFAG